MKSILLLVAASLMLIGATVAVGIPHQQAEAIWCHQPFGPDDCFKNKNDCRDDIPAGVTATCEHAKARK